MQQEKLKKAAWTKIYFLKRPSMYGHKFNTSAKLKLLFWREKVEFKRKMFVFLDGAKIYDLVLKAQLTFRVDWNGINCITGIFLYEKLVFHSSR
jgi:hypothetical protein